MKNDAMIKLRVPDESRMKYALAAKAQGLSLSEWLRMLAEKACDKPGPLCLDDGANPVLAKVSKPHKAKKTIPAALNTVEAVEEKVKALPAFSRYERPAHRLGCTCLLCKGGQR